MKTLADLLRWGLILGIWSLVTYLLWGISWIWAVIWIVPGFILILNLVGFATLPIYAVIAANSPVGKQWRQFHKELDDKLEDGSNDDPSG